MADLLVIVPTRGRPRSVAPIIEAWRATGAFDTADLAFVVDNDDPTEADYEAAWQESGFVARMVRAERWEPLVPKLNAATLAYANDYFAIGFAGDDHLPRTEGWAKAALAGLREMGTGVVYGDDGFRHAHLASSWFMTSDIVRALGRMVPAPVEHMYCDNAVMDLARGADCLRYLPDVLIEHRHPLAGKSEWDSGYARVNSAAQYTRDEGAYLEWRAGDMAADVAKVAALHRLREVAA